MKGGNENKNSMVDRIINSMVKKPAAEKNKVPVKSPVQKFNYQLPKSFFEAVDHARVEAGYDILPRLHHMSVSSSPKNLHHRSHRENRHKHGHSAPSSDHNVSSKKVQLHQKNHQHSHHHQKKKRAESSLASSSLETPKPPSSKRSSAK